MAKKTFVRAARLVKGSRWYIDFQRIDPETGETTRHRQDFDLNDIEDLNVRERVGERLVRYIEVFAPIPKFRTDSEKSDIMPVSAAIETVLALKMRLPRKNSRKTYSAISKKLLAWCERLGYARLPVGEFGKRHARAFWDSLVGSGKYKGRSLNNYLVCLRTMWNELSDRELVMENPFDKIKPERVGEKSRRPFTDEERRIVAGEIEKTDYWLFRALLLQFFCYIRPIELTRLKFRDFDFSRGVVTIREDVHKGYRKHYKTIPASIREYFIDGRFEKCPVNYYVFGLAGTPGREFVGPSSRQISEARMAKRHTKVLCRLKEAGKLSDISGLSWYSWKDTGISLHTRKTSPVATKDQAGHKDLSITSIYYHSEDFNPEYRALENDLF